MNVYKHTGIDREKQMTKGFNFSQRLKFSGHKVWSYLKRPLTGLVLTLGLTLTGTSSLCAWAAELTTSTPPALIASTETVVASNALVTTSNQASGSARGIYLYGQSPEPGQIGHAYAVVEVINNQAIGAFYMPQSSFDCFYGEIQAETLALNVVSSYEQETYQYSIPLTPSSIASTSSISTHPMQLDGYHEIADVSEKDHHILNVCRTALQQTY